MNSKKVLTRFSRSTIAIFFSITFFFIFISGRVSSQNYSTLCNDGMVLEQSGQTESAINKFSDAISIKPTAWKAYSYRAKAYYTLGNYDKAITDISQAITLSPNDISLYEIRANCYLANETYDKALADYNMALSTANKNDVKYITTFFNRGKTLFYNKRYEDAIADFTQSIKLGKNDPTSTTGIYYWMGICYMDLDKYPDAIKDFDLYLAARPNDVKAIFYQGFSYKKNGDADKAKANALKMIDIDPAKEVYFSGDKMLDLYDLDARRATVKKELDEANADIAEYKTNPTSTLGGVKLAEAFTKLDKAWLYSSGIQKADNDVRDTVLKRIFLVYSLMKEKPELPELARKYIVQATSETEDKSYSDALTSWNKAISIAPYYPLSYYNRALLKELLSDWAGAITDGKKYLELSPDATNARTAQDKIYEWEGKLKKAGTTTTTTTTTMTTDKNGTVIQSMNNKAAKGNANSPKPKFIIRTGLVIPKSDFKMSPPDPSKPYVADTTSNFLKNGNMGAKTGMFIELGLGLSFSKDAAKVQFYYNPFLFCYSTNKMSWSNFTGWSADTIRGIRMIEIAQRYGISFRPIPDLLFAVYYRPGAVIPLNFKGYYTKTDSTTYNVYGTMSSKMVFMLSHTFGITVSYKFIGLTLETYFAHPTFDVTRTYLNPSSPTGSYTNRTNTVKIPFRTMRLGLTFIL